MLRRVFGLSSSALTTLAAVAVLPVLAFACGGDDPASTPAPTQPDASVPDGGVPEAAPEVDAAPATISVTVQLPPPAAEGASTVAGSSYVIFYPRESPDQPVVEPAAIGQTVTKAMPEGAHVIVVARTIDGDKLGSLVIEVDDVEGGENIVVGKGPEPVVDHTPHEISLEVPEVDAPDAARMYVRTCNGTVPIEVGASVVAVAKACIDASGEARLLALAQNEDGDDLATSAVVANVNPVNGQPATVQLPAWTPLPTPTPWTLLGAFPGDDDPRTIVEATSDGVRDGVALPTSRAAAGAPLVFFRPPAGFADHELHMLIASTTAGQGPLAYDVFVSEVDRTGPAAAVTTDLSALGPYLTGATISSTPTPTELYRVSFTSSAAPLPDTELFASVQGATKLDATGAPVDAVVTWYTFSSKAAQGYVRGLVLPESVRQSILGTAPQWSIGTIGSISGLPSQTFRANPMQTADWIVGSAFGVDLGLPAGEFRMKVSLAGPSPR